MDQQAQSTVDPAEIARFSAIADSWWDPAGDFRPLHRLNPVRLGYIRQQAERHFGLDPNSLEPLRGLSVLDIGCGGGLLSEPMARLGARVVGVDAAEKNIRVASLHAERAGLSIDYRHDTAEALAAAGEQFDIVLAMEIIEHVADTGAFVGACATLLRPGGLMFGATLNRTLKSYAMAIVGAEYVLRWLPRGTHDWNRFLRPSEFARALRQAGLRLRHTTGVAYQPFDDKWRLDPGDLGVNYMLTADRPTQ
ncbi:bifunctional 2-polyprenyl-6-hydroxyphenol methylase/3-demethylubiquinol 3-O-methyltransferase UbiG [Oceanibacterium hippocampi]|uniref:Ubiquinone biosynthesis O-methyltransferase n=1 Tax=Oceanibacterium hippocampi TaxID=745714 RepID=A0A1Y5R672_9PROT|nr:bifunctional 2-polyprenyl-6-hydroxyphenol methylase/3-demethylubiquinol 3-O-methyltransferase UbiG [Oceanibacterium hippocampi]SLN10103.1 Ubiquinone biosynthesis O-methyltransferase [Oceanibacterium hippocampi]